MMDVKKRDEVIERLFAVLTEDKNLAVFEMEDIANIFADLVRSAGDYLVADVKTEEFVERGWKVMRTHR